ncbi:hypothetical protein [Psychrobacter celer]|uniref:hypothetical protein n=1 Tax=Psychrobacter celer TaxID=306572 RepID=UPI003FD4C018
MGLSIRLSNAKELQTALIELRGAKNTLKRVLAGQRVTEALHGIRQLENRLILAAKDEGDTFKGKHLDHGELSIPNRTKNINADIDRYKADKAKTDKRKNEDRRFLANEAYNALKADKKALAEYAWTEYKKYGTKMIKKHGRAISMKFGDFLTRNLNPRDFLRDEAKHNPKNFLKILEWYLGDSG